MEDKKTSTQQLPYQMVSGYHMPTYEEIKTQIPAITQKVIAMKSSVKSAPPTSELAHYKDDNGNNNRKWNNVWNGSVSIICC